MKNDKLLSGILCTVMLLLALTGCGSETAQSAPQQTSAALLDNAGENVSEETVRQPAIYASSPDFNGAVIHIFADDYVGGDDFVNFYYSKEENGQIINDAAAARTRDTEERLNVTIQYAAPEHGISTLRRSVSAGDGTYDLATAAATIITPGVLDGIFTDLNTVPEMDFSAPWYLPYVNEEIAIHGTQYLSCGCYDIATFGRTSAVFFSPKLADAYGFGNMYQLIENDTWNFDKMFSMAEKVSQDLNGNGTLDIDDRYGICGGYNMNGMLIMTTGYHFTKMDADGNRSLAGCSDKLVAFNDMLVSLYEQPWYFNCYPYGGENRFADASIRFCSDQYLFFLQDVLYSKQFSGSMDSYGILPIPKYEESQDSFRSYGRPMLTAIPSDAGDPSMCAAVLETLNFESMQTLLPAYRNIALSVRYASSEEAEEMLNIIFKNVSVDFAQMWYESLAIKPNLHNSCGVTENYASWYESISSQFEGNLSKLTGTILKVKESGSK